MSPRLPFILAALCLVGVGTLNMQEDNVLAGVLGAAAFFGAGLAVTQAHRPLSPTVEESTVGPADWVA